MIMLQPPVTVTYQAVPGVCVYQEVEEGDGGQEAGEGAHQGAGGQCQTPPPSVSLPPVHTNQGQGVQLSSVIHIITSCTTQI